MHIGAMDPARWNRESGLFRSGDRSGPSSSQPLEPDSGSLGEAKSKPFDLQELLACEPGECWRNVPGRMTFPWGEGPQGDPLVVVKRFEGDLARDRWYERLRGRRRSPAQREYDSLQALAEEGLPVPAALGWTQEGSRSLLVMGYVPHRETVAQRLTRAGAPERRRWVQGVAELAGRLHAAGWYHRDLYLNHFVLSGPQERLVLLDLGRARWERQPRSRWHHKDLGALMHGDVGEHPLGSREWLRGLAIYADRRGIRDRAARRALAAGALGFRARIAGRT